MNNFKKKFLLLKWGIHYDGWLATIYRIFLKITELAGTKGARSTKFLSYVENNYDKRFNVETNSNPSEKEEIKANDQTNHDDAYAPVASTWFGYILSLLPVDLSDFSFIDFGSGKGRALLMASEFPFKQIQGVELERSLHEAAVKNIDSFRSRKQKCSSIHSVNLDVTQFKLPDESLIIFMFNPFSADILKQVLANLHSSFQALPRQIIILYYNPVHKHVIDESAVFKKTDFGINTGSDWAIYATDSTQESP